MRVAARDHYVVPRDSTRACHLRSDSVSDDFGYADDVECGDGYLRVSVGEYNRPHFKRIEYGMRRVGVPMSLKHWDRVLA